MKKIISIVFLTALFAVAALAQSGDYPPFPRHISIFVDIPATEPVDVVAYARGFDGNLLACPLAQSPYTGEFIGRCYNVASLRPVVFFTVTSRANPATVLYYDAANTNYIAGEISPPGPPKGKRFRMVFDNTTP